MNDDDPIEIVTRGELSTLSAAVERLRRLAADAHRARMKEHTRRLNSPCVCGGGDVIASDTACAAYEDARDILNRWQNAAFQKDGAK